MSGSRYTISVVIPNFNTRDLLRDCLHSVYRQGDAGLLTIVVVDNGSSDGSAAMVEAEFPAARLVRNGRNLGYSGAINVGLRHLAPSDLTVILNSDTVVHDGAFLELCRQLAPLKDVGAACPRCDDGTGAIQSYGTEIWTAKHFLRFYAFQHVILADRDASESIYVGSASGACLCLTRRGLEAIRQFDEKLVLYLEEQDLARRLQQKNLRCYYVSTAVVTHFGGRTTRQLDGSALFLAIHLSHAYFLSKHFGLGTAQFLRALAALHMSLRALSRAWRLAVRRRDAGSFDELRVRVSAARGYMGLYSSAIGPRTIDKFYPGAVSVHKSPGSVTRGEY